YLSAQGVAYRVLSRKPVKVSLPSSLLNQAAAQVAKSKDADEQPGPVTTDLLAISMQGILNNVRNDLRITFQQAVHASCQNLVLTSKLLHTSVIANPTLTMRQLLNEPYLLGHASGELVEVWPCQKLKPQNYRFLAMNDTCTKEIPLEFNLRGVFERGYLNPTTKIIQPTATEVDCALIKSIVLQLNGSSVSYSAQTGELTAVESVPVLGLLKYNYTELVHIRDTVYHQLVMHNWSEIQSQITLNDMQGALQHHINIIRHLEIGGQQLGTQSAHRVTSNLMQKGQFGFLTGLAVDWKQIWIFMVCTYVTVFAIIVHCCPCSIRYLPNLLDAGRHILRSENSNRSRSPRIPRRRYRHGSNHSPNGDTSRSILRRFSNRLSSGPNRLIQPRRRAPPPHLTRTVPSFSPAASNEPTPRAEVLALHSSDGSENESWTTPIPDSRQNSHENSPHKRTPVARADLVFEPPLPPHIISRFHRMATAGRRSSSTLREQVEAAYDEVKRRLLPAHSSELPSTSHRALDPPESQVIHAIEDDRPLSATVSCTVNGQLNIGALTDTGSGYTLIFEDLVEQLHLPDHIRQPFNGKVPKSVTGHPLTLIGTIDLSIRVGETEFSNHRTHILPC
ncbi:MAG: retropepsin-like aspartic protease, partial [Pirellulales bacterium]